MNREEFIKKLKEDAEEVHNSKLSSADKIKLEVELAKKRNAKFDLDKE